MESRNREGTPDEMSLWLWAGGVFVAMAHHTSILLGMFHAKEVPDFLGKAVFLRVDFCAAPWPGSMGDLDDCWTSCAVVLEGPLKA